MDFIETLTAIVKEVIKEPCQTIKEDRIESLVERSNTYLDFINRVLYEWSYRHNREEKAQVKNGIIRTIKTTTTRV